MQKNPRMDFLLPHFMNYGIDRWGRKFIDQYGIIMMRIAAYFFVHFITKK